MGAKLAKTCPLIDEQQQRAKLRLIFSPLQQAAAACVRIRAGKHRDVPHSGDYFARSFSPPRASNRSREASSSAK
jgi:hypothetical protein